MVTNSTKIINGIKWNLICRHDCMESGLQYSKYQHQDLAGNWGSDFKLALVCFYHNLSGILVNILLGGRIYWVLVCNDIMRRISLHGVKYFGKFLH